MQLPFLLRGYQDRKALFMKTYLNLYSQNVLRINLDIKLQISGNTLQQIKEVYAVVLLEAVSAVQNSCREGPSE